MTHTIEIHRFVPTDVRLGRHVHHDSRSLNFMFLPKEAKPKKINSFWDSAAKALDQGQVGSCTGNATVQCLNAHFFDIVRKAVRRGGGYFTEADALKVYSLATTLDGDPDRYPPTDTGSDGVSVAKAAVKLGWLDKYTHTMSITSAQAAAEVTPFIQGTLWTKSMFNPVNGLVKVGKLIDSNIAGGHEYEGAGIDWKSEVMLYRNSWGDQDAWPGSKPGGYFAIGFGKSHSYDFENLIENQGDVTILHGVDQSAKAA